MNYQPADGKNENNRWTKVTPNKKKENCDVQNVGNNKTTKSKSARKNERRKELKRLRREQQQKEQKEEEQKNDRTTATYCDEDVEDEILLARMVSLEESNSNSNLDPRKKRLRKLRKKLSEAKALSAKLKEKLDEEQQRKVEQIPFFQQEIISLENDIEAEQLADIQKEKEEQEELRKANQERLAEWKAWSDGAIVKGFGDDDEFSCPLCAGPLEAAMITIPCQHVFCRACLEDSLAAAAIRSQGDPTSIVCPLCRCSLLDSKDTTLRVTVEAAERIRRKMKKKKCVCRCGTEISLGSLRLHLRNCEEGAPALFGGDERKCFGHEKFEQPKLDPVKIQQWKGGEHSISIDVPEGYDEEAEIQAAILMSLNIGG